MLLHSLFFKTTCDVLWLGYNTACSRYRAYQSPLYVIILQCKRRNKALSFFFTHRIYKHKSPNMIAITKNILEDVYSIQIFDILFGFCYVHDGRFIEYFCVLLSTLQTTLIFRHRGLSATSLCVLLGYVAFLIRFGATSLRSRHSRRNVTEFSSRCCCRTYPTY